MVINPLHNASKTKTWKITCEAVPVTYYSIDVPLAGNEQVKHRGSVNELWRP